MYGELQREQTYREKTSRVWLRHAGLKLAQFRSDSEAKRAVWLWLMKIAYHTTVLCIPCKLSLPRLISGLLTISFFYFLFYLKYFHISDIRLILQLSWYTACISKFYQLTFMLNNNNIPPYLELTKNDVYICICVCIYTENLFNLIYISYPQDHIHTRMYLI